MYGVLSKRRGAVLDDEMIEGTDLFLISATLPVAESSGFSTELLSKTSGSATAPLLSFSHWAPMDVDPFWRPTTQEERDEHGEAYASHEVLWYEVWVELWYGGNKAESRCCIL